jgi:hypothetical protein
MLTALSILGMIAVIVLIAGLVLVAVKISESLSKQADVLDRAHERWVNLLDPLFNKLLAHNWEEYTTLQELSEPQEGGFFTDEEQREEEEGGMEYPLPPWGSINTRSNIPRPSADEERLLAEDFDDADEPRRSEMV